VALKEVKNINEPFEISGEDIEKESRDSKYSNFYKKYKFFRKL